MNELLMSIPVWGWVIILLWEVIWKAIAMWHAARKNQLVWFILIVIINSIGILSIIYLLINRKKSAENQPIFF